MVTTWLYQADFADGSEFCFEPEGFDLLIHTFHLNEPVHQIIHLHEQCGVIVTS